MLYAIAAVAAVLLLSKSQGVNPLNPRRVGPAAPGPGAQSAGNVPVAGSTVTISPPNFTIGTGSGSPNSTLATINGGIVLANNALGMYDQVSGQYTNSDSNQSEYPIDDNPGFVGPPSDNNVNSLDYTQSGIDVQADSQYF